MTAVNRETPIQVSNPPQVEPKVEKAVQTESNPALSLLTDGIFESSLLNWPFGFLNSRCTLIMSDEYKQIRSSKDEPFSKLFENHDLEKIAAVLPRDLLKQKFDQEFGTLSDEELLKKFSLDELETLADCQIVANERIEPLKAKDKELARQESGSCSELVKKYGSDRLAEYFSAEELNEKFNAECNGKTDEEILSNIDFPFFSSQTGRAMIGERFKERFSKGEVKVEKDNVERTFELTPDRYAIKQTVKHPDGWSSYTYRTTTYKN
jgi:hypothetical protein